MKHILAECRGRRGGMAHQRPRSRIRNHYFFCCCIPIFILSLIVLPRVGAVATHKRSTEKEEDNSSSSSSSDGDDEEEDENEEYLYHIEAAKGIIHDYEPPKDNSTRPDFLYGTNQGPRVVEFYAPWCPHCQHFRKHYIGFAKQVNELITEYEQNNHKKNDNTHRGSSLTAASTPPVQFYAISCTINRKLCQKQGIHGYPVIKLFAANATVNATGEILYWKLHAFDALDILQIRIDNADHDRTKFDAKTKQIDDQSSKSTGSAVAKKRKRTRKRKPQKQQKLNQQVLYRTKQQIFDDAHLSLIFNLRNSVFISDDENQPLSNATKIALKNWLELVAQTTPVLWPMRSTIRAILAEFDLATAKEANLLAILDRFPPPISHWSASCTKGVSGMGYTCGLWELFHIMSVGLVEYNLVIPAEDDLILRELSISPTHAAETFRNFVEYFFACDECRRNFLHAYDNCALDRCIRFNEKERDYEQWILFPVWLFETHNAVNQRLLQERTKRENHGAATKPQSVASSQWPAKTACPKCWLDSGGWDEEAVYKFLRTDYWTEDTVSMEYRLDVGAMKKKVANSGNRLPLPTVPLMSLCTLVVLAIVFSYAKRTKLMKTGRHKKCDGDC